MKNEEIIEFINRRFVNDCNWLDGNCYWFMQILTQRFPRLREYLLPVQNHFMAGDNEGKWFYDWTGAHHIDDLVEKPILFLDILREDPTWYYRLLKDCAN